MNPDTGTNATSSSVSPGWVSVRRAVCNPARPPFSLRAASPSNTERRSPVLSQKVTTVCLSNGAQLPPGLVPGGSLGA